MITLIHSKKDHLSNEIVYKALIRSFASNQVDRSDQIPTNSGIIVFINPENISLTALPPQSKIIIFGNIDSLLAKELDIQILDEKNNFTTESVIQFHCQHFPISSRPFVRYDFPNEWNNLGYGGIQTDKSIWSVSQLAKSKNAIATIDEQYAYITLHDFEERACLWINREVGLVDSANWHFIENFVSGYRFSELYSQPYLLDIPAHTEAAVTMRLDCDEDIISAKPLFDLYQKENIPFSLAVKTSLPIEQDEIYFLNQVRKNGSILSHSVNHKVSWGDDYQDALAEAKQSKETIENHFEDTTVEFAVSPFHSNRDYAVKALKDAGYNGFVAGLIAYDPEYLMARGGAVPFCDDIISHSQQCMLHGDCLLPESDSIRVYKEAFENALKSKTFFGFLDHPFSPRYQYGWLTEVQRVKAHADFIEYMKSRAKVTFFSEADCLLFMIDKSNAEIHYDQNQAPTISFSRDKRSPYGVAVSLNNQVYC